MVIPTRLLLFLLHTIKLFHQSIRLPFHIDERLEHLIADRDDLRVRLETALRDDHIGEFIGNVRVAHLKRRRRDCDAQRGIRTDRRLT